KTYEFDGWYRYTGVPDHDERLTNRFYGDEYLTTPDDFTLAAQWKQKTGLAPYYIVCVLRDDDGTSRTIPLEGAQGEWEIGTALRIPAPSTTQFPELDGYYPLKSMGSIKNFQPGTDDTVTFYYRAAVRLPYYIDYQVTLRDVDNSLDSETIVFFTEDHLTSADNVFVMANDEVEGFRLDPEIQDQREIIKATDSEGKEFMSPERVSFSYALGAGSIRAVDGEWKKGTDQYPSLLQIVNGTKNKLDCLSENRVLRVRYTLGVTTYDSLDDLLRTGNALAELDAGTYGVTVSLELWRTDEAGNPASRVLTAYRGTSTVTVSES
ncbi:MAG: hypothetical protein IJU66_09535, partial [Oscillospiraceae bacterium]|nr:hypothetical protein [Oscillospiraceae bacterium]